MKQIIAFFTGMAITMAAMAYPHPNIGGHVPVLHPVVVVHQPYYGGFGYPSFYAPYWGYNAFYSPFYGYVYRPSKLDLDIEQITNDYQEQIADVRHNTSLSRRERRSEIRTLRHQKENSILEAKQKYYHPRQQPHAAADDTISEP